jgi:DNA-binding transcriptional LysR family regulator
MPRLAGGLLARAVVRFRAAHPDVIVAIHSGDDDTVNHWLATGFCDAALTMLYGKVPDVRLDQVETRACVAVLPQGHPLSTRPALTPEHFRGVPFVASSLGSALRSRTETIFEAAGVDLTITAEAGLGASICTLVSAGLGVSVMNPLAAHEEAKVSPIAIRPFSPALPVHFALLFPPDHARGRLMRAFGACARAVLLEELAQLPDAATERPASRRQAARFSAP